MSIPKILQTLSFCALALLAILATPDALAQTATPTVDQFFTVDRNDRSAALLAQVFGPEVWETINGEYSPNTMTATGQINNSDQSGVLGAVSLVLNLGCMLLTVIIILWGAISANMSGTLDGHEAGRRYNLFWTPFRSVYSFALLLPVIGGYSLIQVILMKLMLISIGIANAGYNIVLDRMIQGRATAPVEQPNVNDTVQNMLLISLCQRILKDEEGRILVFNPPDPTPQSYRNTGPQSSGFFEFLGDDSNAADRVFNKYVSVSYDGLVGSNYTRGVCGSWFVKQTAGGAFSPDAARAAADDLFQYRVDATLRLKREVDQIADMIIAEVAPSPAGSALPSASGGPTSTFLADATALYRSATDNYRSSLVDASRRAAAAMSRDNVERVMQKNNSASTTAATQAIREGGWIMTGAIYWNLGAINKSITEVVKTLSASATSPKYQDIGDHANINQQEVGQALSKAKSLLDNVKNDPERKTTDEITAVYLTAQGNVDASDGVLDTLYQYILQKFPSLAKIDDFILEQLLQDGDFVSNLSNIGNWCWNLGWALFGAATVADLVGSVLGGAASGAGFGTDGGGGGGGGLLSKLGPLGKIAGAIGGAVNGLAAFIGSILTVMMVPLIIVGFFLGFYLPMIPLILWCINIAGWIIITIKTFLAGPIWAAAHSIPEGEGIAGQHARQGYTMLLGILLRPILLTIGIIVGGIVLQVVGWFLRYILPVMFASFDTTGATGFFGFVAVLVITAVLCCTLAAKCFSLSHEVADEILEWIGGRQYSLGDEAASGRNQQVVMGVLSGQAAGTLGTVAGRGLTRLGGLNQGRLAGARNAVGAGDKTKRNQLSTGG